MRDQGPDDDTEMPSDECQARRRIVVVVDDNQIVRRAVSAELTRAGFQALSYDNGFSVLEFFAMGEPVDALVTDIHMPGSLDGLFVALEARSQRPNLPVVYMSARRAPDAGLVDDARFLSKPCAIGDVSGAVSSALRECYDRAA
ncbi:response regulator [Methylobacterium brachiatum]